MRIIVHDPGIIMLKLAFAAALSTVSLPTALQAASEEPQVMIIMDSSGSMKRRIGARTKMEIAQDAVSKFVLDAPTHVPIGLMAYGRRRAKDCSDIEVMIPPAAKTGMRIEQAVDGMRPKGETPIADSLLAAADYMQARSRTATVVLVTDGEEACNADPCAAAAELEQANVEFTAHVVGFGLSEAQSKAVKCLADNTGGQFIAADDVASLSSALVKTVAEPETAPVIKVADRTVWFDDFEGDKLGEAWSVRNADPDAYVVDGGQLVTINANKHDGPKSKKAPNVFDATLDLPSGDWDLAVHGKFEFSTGRDAFALGLADDDGNAVYALVYSTNNSNGYSMHLGTRQFKGFAQAAAANSHYAPWAKATKKKSIGSAEFAKRETTMTLHKRGRKYYATINNGPAGEQGQSESLTLLRVPKRLSMMAWKYGNGEGDTVANIDWVKLTAVD